VSSANQLRHGRIGGELRKIKAIYVFADQRFEVIQQE